MKKVLLSISLWLILIIPVYAKTTDVSIITTRPIVGHKIEVSNHDPRLSYRWFVNEKEVSDKDYFIPDATCYESWIEVNAYLNNSVVASDKIYFSKLPVVYINTKTNREINRSDYVKANMKIQGNINHEMQYDGMIKIKGRGTSSWHYDKKPYKLKLDTETDLFGFGKGKHFVLLANYLDISELRNTFAYRLADYAGLTSTDTTWVVVIFNDQYQGLYQLTEHVRIGEQLIDTTDWEEIAQDAASAIAKANKFSDNDLKELEDIMETDLSWITDHTVAYEKKTYNISDYYPIDKAINHGYLLELDNEEDKEISNFITDHGIMIQVSKPEYLNTNPEMFNYVKNFIQDYENAIYQIDGYNEEQKSYIEYVNMDSLVSYWLVNEILANDDAARGSRYIYIGNDNKITYGPVWDFDISSQSFRSFANTTGWTTTNSILSRATKQDIYREIVKDPYFQVKAQEKYWELREYLNDMVKNDGLIDQYTDYLYEAAVKNEIKWTNPYMPRSFTGKKGDPEIYRNFLRKRIAWLDKVFQDEESITKYLELSPKNSLTKDKKIKIKVNLPKENETFLLNKNQDINLQITTKYENYKVYVNGIYYGKYSNNNHNIRIKYSALNEEVNKKNVITIMSENKMNFITLLLKETSKKNIKKEKKYELSTCSENYLNLVTLQPRKVEKDKYGIKEAKYSNNCYKYYSMDNKPLHAKEVITSLSTSNNYWGVYSYIKLIVILGTICVFALILIILKKVRKKKKVKKRK